MIDFEDLYDNLGCVRIAHHIRGRIRLQLHAYPRDLPAIKQSPGHIRAEVEAGRHGDE